MRISSRLRFIAKVWFAGCFLASARATIISADAAAINVRSVPSVKRAVKQLVAAGNVAPGWTGNVATGDAGTTSPAYQLATLKGVNIMRKLAGVPSVVFDTELGAKCAQAALMMSANHQLDHFPPPSWTFYTAGGALAAGHSNLFLGLAGPSTIPGYIDDSGSGNELVGHRRWILWSQSQVMGTGDVLGGGAFSAANALWVLPTGAVPSPTTRGGFVAWPYAGSIPNTLVFQRWSFGVPLADFSAAKVSVKLGTRMSPPASWIARPPASETTRLSSSRSKLTASPTSVRFFTRRI
jgi:hypothetical protein